MNAAYLVDGLRTPFGRYGGALAAARRDDAEHVNPNGGAIALGHPLGASGGRLALAAAVELSVRSAGRAVATMCIGVGQGISLLLETP